MTDLDSRRLRFTDMFGQKFLRPGIAAYRVLQAGAELLGLDGDHAEFAIEIAAQREDDELSRQHHVNVRRVDDQLAADPPKLKIAVGDVVTWHAPDTSTAPYVIEGVGPSGPFGSASMVEQAIFTHAFGLPGSYRWVDANGSELYGEVEVTDAQPTTRAESKRWAESIATARVVHIKDGSVVTGRFVSVPVGGTVCWAVESAPAISISDSRLIEKAPVADGVVRKAQVQPVGAG